MLIPTSALPAFTIVHVAISLAAILSGFIVVYGMIINKRLDGWTAFFLATTLLTSVTGFGFPINGMTPGIVIGIISIVLLTAVIYARYAGRLAGACAPCVRHRGGSRVLPQLFGLDRAVVPESPCPSCLGAEAIRTTVLGRAGCVSGRVHCAWNAGREKVSAGAAGCVVSKSVGVK